MAVWAAIVLVVGAAVLPPGAGRVSAATGSELGRYISGIGMIPDPSSPGDSVGIAVDATIGPEGGVSGSYTWYANGVPTESGIVDCAFVIGQRAALGLGVWPDRQLISIDDNGSTGDTLWIDTADTYGGDCTAGPQADGTALSEGDFSIGPLPSASDGPSSAPDPSAPSSTQGPPAPSPIADDINGDGIADVLQPSGTPDGSFVDLGVTPNTFGSVISTGGLSVRVSDAASPDGVLISVGTEVTEVQAELLLCGFTVLLDPGTFALITCGSVKVDVSTGGASIVLGGGLTVVGIPAGAVARVTESDDGSFTVENLGSVDGTDVTVTVDGTTSPVGTGQSTSVETWDFVGFASPIDAAPTLNRVKAGQAVPLRWRLLDASGAPVVDLAPVRLFSTSLDCGAGAAIDPVEEVAAGGSGLLNLGNGYYLLNWKSLASYADSCRNLHLDIGDGVSHDAYFRFTR